MSNLVTEVTMWYILRVRDTLNMATDVEVLMPAMEMEMSCHLYLGLGKSVF